MQQCRIHRVGHLNFCHFFLSVRWFVLDQMPNISLEADKSIRILQFNYWSIDSSKSPRNYINLWYNCLWIPNKVDDDTEIWPDNTFFGAQKLLYFWVTPFFFLTFFFSLFCVCRANDIETHSKTKAAWVVNKCGQNKQCSLEDNFFSWMEQL